MTPPSIETSTDARSKGRVELCSNYALQEGRRPKVNKRTTSGIRSREMEMYAQLRAMWQNATFSKDVTQKLFMLIILKEGDRT